MNAKRCLVCLLIIVVGFALNAPSLRVQAVNSFDPIQRVSVSTAGAQGNADSFISSIAGGSAFAGVDGRYIVFTSEADNLVGGDTNDLPDIFLHDRWSGFTTLISLAPDGSQFTQWKWRDMNPTISTNARFIAFQTVYETPAGAHTVGIFVRDRSTNTTTLIDSPCKEWPVLAADGRFLACRSYDDVFTYDRRLRTSQLVSIGYTGGLANNISLDPGISANGRYVIFDSPASNITPGDTNGYYDVFLTDMLLHKTIRISLGVNGQQPDAEAYSWGAIAGDGIRIAFASVASTLVPDDTNNVSDIFVRDMTSGELRRISVANDGTEANGASDHPIISLDGNYLAFASAASNLVPGDTNNVNDIFVYSWWDRQIFRASLAADGTQANGDCVVASLSEDGRYVAFSSTADNLVTGDTNGVSDIFVAPANFASNAMPDQLPETVPETAPTFMPSK